MTIFARYISYEILKATFAITTVILLVVGSGRFTYYLSKAVAGDLSTSAVLEIMLNLFPVYLSTILPLGALLGVLFALGRLSVDNEIVVMFANGVSLNRLLALVSIPVFSIATIVLVLSLVVAPYGARMVAELLYVEYRTNKFEHIVAGKFHADNERQVIYAQNISADQSELLNVFVFNQQTTGETVLIRAEKAWQEYKDEFSGKYLWLENGTRTEFSSGNGQTTITEFAQMGMLVNDADIDVTITDSYALPTSELWLSNSLAHQAQLYWRISLPLLTIIMAAMAVALAQVKPRQGRYLRIVLGIVLFLGYIYALIFFRDQMVANVPNSAVKMALVHIAFGLFSIWMLYGTRLRQLLITKNLSRHKVVVS